MGISEIRVRIINIEDRPWRSVFDNFDTTSRHSIKIFLNSLYFWHYTFPKLIGIKYVIVPKDYENIKVVSYFCGLLSSFLNRDVDIMDTEGNFYPACTWTEDYAYGRNGEVYGYKSFDRFLFPLRRRVRKRYKRRIK